MLLNAPRFRFSFSGNIFIGFVEKDDHPMRQIDNFNMYPCGSNEITILLNSLVSEVKHEIKGSRINVKD